jgi:hypothetical protein
LTSFSASDYIFDKYKFLDNSTIKARKGKARRRSGMWPLLKDCLYEYLVYLLLGIASRNQYNLAYMIPGYIGNLYISEYRRGTDDSDINRFDCNCFDLFFN